MCSIYSCDFFRDCRHCSLASKHSMMLAMHYVVPRPIIHLWNLLVITTHNENHFFKYNAYIIPGSPFTNQFQSILSQRWWLGTQRYSGNDAAIWREVQSVYMHRPKCHQWEDGHGSYLFLSMRWPIYRAEANLINHPLAMTYNVLEVINGKTMFHSYGLLVSNWRWSMNALSRHLIYMN